MPDDEKPDGKVDADLARRMFVARHYREGQLGRALTLSDISRAVSASLKREEPYDPSVIARWLKGTQEPRTRPQWVALARALAVDVGWLAFGLESAAPAPATYPGQVEAGDLAPGTPVPKPEKAKAERSSARSSRGRR